MSVPESRRPSLALLIGWTLAVALVVILLTRLASAESTRQLLSLKEPEGFATSPGRQILRWLVLAHLSVYRVYPWLILAPWLIVFTARFHLERGRFRLSVPAQLVACVASIAGARLLNDEIGSRQPDLFVFAISESRSGDNTNELREFRAQTLLGPDAPLSTNPPSADREAERWKTHLRTAMETLSRDRERDPGDSPPPGRAHVIEDSEVVLLATPRDSRPAPHAVPGKSWELKHTRRLRVGPHLWGPGALSDYLFHLLAYGSLVGIAHALHFRRRLHERERRALALESSLARTRLHALQAQLHPHFLFNALNSVIALLRQNPRAAEEMLVSLGELLRLVLNQSQHQETSLHDEMRFLDLYMEIQQLRFGDRLKYATDIAPDAWGCRIPTLLLQPLVENAVRHGIEPSGRPGLIRVAARRDGNRLRLEVRDNGMGSGLPQGEAPRLGVGLSNVQARLSSYFGNAASLDFSTPQEGGFQVTLELPALEHSDNPIETPSMPPSMS